MNLKKINIHFPVSLVDALRLKRTSIRREKTSSVQHERNE